jgi:hypothetical protein
MIRKLLAGLAVASFVVLTAGCGDDKSNLKPQGTAGDLKPIQHPVNPGKGQKGPAGGEGNLR